MIQIILLVFAFVLALLAAFDWPRYPRLHLGWLAFAFFCAAFLFGNVTGLR